MPDLIPFPTLETAAHRLAEDIATCLQGAVDTHGRSSFAVSGGRTPEHILPIIADKALPWDRITITLADERWVAADHPDSNEGLTRRLLMQGPAAAARFVGLKNGRDDPFSGQEKSNTALATLDWPLAAVFLGMGEDGHIASLFPGDGNWREAPGRALAVAASGIRQPRMSLTPGALLDSHHIFLILTGTDKRAAYDAALKSGPAEELPARLILRQDRVPVTVYAVD